MQVSTRRKDLQSLDRAALSESEKDLIYEQQGGITVLEKKGGCSDQSYISTSATQSEAQWTRCVHDDIEV